MALGIVSGAEFGVLQPPNTVFLASVSARHFSISVLAGEIEAKTGLTCRETGSQVGKSRILRGHSEEFGADPDYARLLASPMRLSRSAQEYGSALTNAVTVRSWGTLLSAIAAVISGERNAS